MSVKLKLAPTEASTKCFWMSPAFSTFEEIKNYYVKAHWNEQKIKIDTSVIKLTLFKTIWPKNKKKQIDKKDVSKKTSFLIVRLTFLATDASSKWV